MKNIYLVCILLISIKGYSQFNPNSPWKNNQLNSKDFTFQGDVSFFNEYWTTHDKKKKGSGYKPFKRWVNRWANLLNTNGSLMTSQQLWSAWQEKNNQKTNRNNLLFSLPPSNWQPIGPMQNAQPNSTMARGRVNIVHVDPNNPNTIYFGTPAGGIWKSTNNGTTWVPLADELPQIGVSGIAVDYSNSNTIYISTGDKDATDTYSIGVMKSTDGGTTWNTTGLSFSNTFTTAGDIVIHPTDNQILWCATSAGLYRTTNAGTNWTMVQSGDFSQGSIRLKPGTPSTVYAVSNNKFYRSTDSGATFTNIVSLLPASSGRMLLDVTPANPEYVYVLSATIGSAFQGIYRSTNGGTTWVKRSNATDIFESTQAWYDLAFAASPTNAEQVFTGCLNVWRSNNGGTSSTKLNNWSTYNSSFTHADIHYLGYHGTKLYCGSDGGIYDSDTNGAVFTEKTGAAQIGQFYKISVSKQTAGKIAGGLQDNGGFAYNNDTWRGYHGGDGMDNAISPLNSNLYYGFIYNGDALYISNNAGLSLSSGVTGPESGNWVTPLVVNSGGEVFSGFTKLYKLVNNNWVVQSAATVGSGNIDYIEVAPTNNDIMFVSNGTQLFKSTNRGLSFSLVYTAPSAITSIDVNYSDANIVYITTSGVSGTVRKSSNGGSTFTDITSGIPNIGKNIIIHQGRNSLNPLYVGTSLGVYYRDDSMSSFQAFDTNLPNVDVTDLEINLEDGKIIAGTYGRGIWQSNIPIEIPSNDVKLVSIQQPTTGVACSGSVTPQVEVKNNGLNTINSVAVNYTVDGALYTYNWSGTIAAGNTQNIVLPTGNFAKGTHNLSVITTILGDAYADNNSSSTVFYVNDAGTVGVVNPFTNTADALVSYNEGSSGSQWQRATRNNGNAMDSPTNMVYTSNLSGNYPDMVKSYLVSQCYNLNNVINPQISFSMKYDLELNWDIVYVEYSTDFGANWSVLGTMGTNWYNSDRTPTTTGEDCNNCLGAQWTGTNTTEATYSYPLNALNTESNIIFRIVFHTDEAANQLGVNVDNFVINGTLSNTAFEAQNVVVYPNPSNGIFKINFGTIQPLTLEVYDVAGKQIITEKDIIISNFESNLDLSNASNGIYFIKITTENTTFTKRIIKN